MLILNIVTAVSEEDGRPTSSEQEGESQGALVDELCFHHSIHSIPSSFSGKLIKQIACYV